MSEKKTLYWCKMCIPGKIPESNSFFRFTNCERNAETNIFNDYDEYFFSRLLY